MAYGLLSVRVLNYVGLAQQCILCTYIICIDSSREQVTCVPYIESHRAQQGLVPLLDILEPSSLVSWTSKQKSTVSDNVLYMPRLLKCLLVFGASDIFLQTRLLAPSSLRITVTILAFLAWAV